ncbi:hypothetical protein MBLNU457_1346t1 [Dothideomycetes sp. NU457]
MEVDEDEELRLVRASGALLSDLEDNLPRLLWKRKDSPNSTPRVHQYVRKEDLVYIVQLIEPFQSEPQLLDSRLRVLVPPIVDAYLALIQLPPKERHSSKHIELQSAICTLLYTLCKVRGEKIISGFLNNEPRFLQPILTALEDSVYQNESTAWQTSYVLMLWLSHLLLAPFDLASVSDQFPRHESVKELGLSEGLPNVVRRVVAVGLTCIRSVTKEQDAAAKMMVRLVNRPDMQQLGLPKLLVSWASELITSNTAAAVSNMNACVGPLRFLVGMTVSPDTEQTSSLIPEIYFLAERLYDIPTTDSTMSSAVIRKQVLKALRNIATLGLKTTHDELRIFWEDNGVLEDVIDMLLQALSDRDTPVRFAASKAISTILTKLGSGMGCEVNQAVIDELGTDIPVKGGVKSGGGRLDFSMANPLKWHGLTLTLAYNLFRRTAYPLQLWTILDALLRALSFEQRATTGQSVGTNVRDAACFGLWALSRRYTTAELLSVKVEDITATLPTERPISVIQFVATQLLISACLDPASNVRRACSAALQELIGRHPDQVYEGISLVQIVDYQAVGLRKRAMIDVANKAAALHVDYWRALISRLSDWRGLAAPDVLSREAAAESIGRLCGQLSAKPYEFRWLYDDCLKVLGARTTVWARVPVEERHGALLAVSAIADSTLSTNEKLTVCMIKFWEDFTATRSSIAESDLAKAELFLTEFTPRALKAELYPAAAKAIVSLTEFQPRSHLGLERDRTVAEDVEEISFALFGRSETSILDSIPELVHALYQLYRGLDLDTSLLDIEYLIEQLRNDSERLILHGAGRAIALGAAFSELSEYSELRSDIMTALGYNLLWKAPIIEWRVVGLQALQLTVPHLTDFNRSSHTTHLCFAINAGLDDYTITERGDVGSLVRLQAIDVVTEIWRTPEDILSEREDTIIQAKLLRLSLEKLDRVRLAAFNCLKGNHSPGSMSSTDVSSTEYFKTALKPLTSPACPQLVREALVQGLLSSAGSGNEALLQTSRSALSATLSTPSKEALTLFLTTLTDTLKTQIAKSTDTTPALELLAYLLDSLPLPDLVQEDFKWRNVLAYVQKSHFKSTIVPKLVAAVDVYRGLGTVDAIREDVVKKLMGMARTNPYSQVRMAAVEALWCLTSDEALKEGDWMGVIGGKEKEILKKLEEGLR